MSSTLGTLRVGEDSGFRSVNSVCVKAKSVIGEWSLCLVSSACNLDFDSTGFACIQLATLEPIATRLQTCM